MTLPLPSDTEVMEILKSYDRPLHDHILANGRMMGLPVRIYAQKLKAEHTSDTRNRKE